MDSYTLALQYYHKFPTKMPVYTEKKEKIKSKTKTNSRWHPFSCKPNQTDDMLSRLQHPISEDIECSDPDITHKTFEVNFIDSSRIDPKKYAKYHYQYEDKQCNNEELGVPRFELVILKENLQTEKASWATTSKHIVLDNILYYLSKCDSNPVIRL